jgi:hypothetical protein
MKKALTIGLAGAAVAATLSFVATSLKTEGPVVSEAKAAESEPEAAPIVLAQVLNYDRGPRIIIVPQAGDRMDRSRASVNRDVYEDDDVAPPPVRTAPRWAPNLESKRSETPRVEPPPRRVETPVKSRTETRSEPRKVRHIDMSKPKPKVEAEVPIPQPPSPRRAVLSAPPLPAEGPTPIKPTPRFGSSALGAKAEVKPAEPQADTSYDSPPPGEITADSPPPGYTPPAALPRDDGYGNKY